MKIVNHLAVVAAAALLFSCSQSTQSSQFTQAEAAQQITERNQQWMAAVEAGDAAAVAAIYSPTTTFMPPHVPTLKGTEGVQAYIESAITSGVKKILVETLELEVNGAQAIEIGSYQVLVAGDQVAEKGKYLIEWRHEGGQWYMHRDMFNSDLPEARSVAQQGQNMQVVVYHIKADRRQDFENFVRHSLVPAIDQSKPENGMAVKHTRFMIPDRAETDGSYRYMFVMDPLIEGVDYGIEPIMIQKYGELQAKSLMKDFASMQAAGFQLITGTQSEL
jgi:ketosteroid isomerase-like protein